MQCALGYCSAISCTGARVLYVLVCVSASAGPWRTSCVKNQAATDVALFIHGLSSISILAQVEVVRLKFLSKSGGHLLLLVLGNFTIFPVHSVG